ncbi:glycosyltransferase [Nostoc sp. FACHB-190]|uniref:glycosyltransferase n=1 Tax=Nostoc sp. FACHB-190 TaxID=2692838 RepID=UPI001682D266|nr:glycosyltransferase [Nostoc sp. FACHB-190]MBD2297299.1 hypothetical protein [Nostoc sp. FACHB-190]
MQKSNKIIQGLWIGGELSTMEQLSIASFIKSGHEYHLYIYNDVQNIPKDTVIKDGNEILPSEMIFTYQSGWGKGSYAGFADLFRYHLLRKRGGWWVDTDVICLKPFDFESDSVISSSYEGKWGTVANTCVLKLPENDYLANSLCEISQQKDLGNIAYGDIGPLLLQKLVSELDYKKHLVSHEAFCPITWRAVNKIVYSTEKMTMKKAVKAVKDLIRPIIYPETNPGKITSNSYAVHLWNEIWRQNKLDKNANYDKNCLYERLKAKYL